MQRFIRISLKKLIELYGPHELHCIEEVNRNCTGSFNREMDNIVTNVTFLGHLSIWTSSYMKELKQTLIPRNS